MAAQLQRKMELILKFSHRNEFDPNRPSGPIINDAPNWLRNYFFADILSDYIFIDLDNSIHNLACLPLGIKSLNERLCMEIDRELDDFDWNSDSCKDGLKYTIRNCSWFKFYDFVETIGEEIIKKETKDDIYLDTNQSLHDITPHFEKYQKQVNNLFRKHSVEWLLNSNSKLETALPKALAERINNTEKSLDKFEAARDHYKKAKGYALGTHKDSENSIKESISALESVGKVLYPKTATLGDVLKHMKKDESIPKMLVDVIQRFYDYANSEPGVRHGGSKKPNSDELDAELALHLSAAFIRYVIKTKSQSD